MLKELPRVKEKEQLLEVKPQENPAPKDPKKWRVLRRICLGLATFVLINFIVVLLEPYFLHIASYELNHAAEKILLYQDQPAPDILFLGSSRVENGLDPAIIEQTIAEQTGVRPRALNLGMPNSSLQLSYLVLKNIIQNNKKPSVIVYGLAELELDNPAPDDNYYKEITTNIPNSEVLFRPDDLGRYGGNQLEQQANFMFGQLVPLFRDQKLILKALNIQFNSENINHANYERDAAVPSNGFLAINQTLSHPETETNAGIYKEQLPAFQPSNTDLGFLRDFLKLAKDRGIKVVLVNMPVSAVHQAFWNDDARLKAYRDTVQNLARENEVPLLDVYRDDELLAPESFYDTNHLNSQGATILSQKLARDYLKDYFKLPANISTDFYKVKWTDLEVPARLPANLKTTGKITFQNLSQSYWPTFGEKSVRVGYHWLKPDGSPYLFEGDRTKISYTLRPGSSQTIRFNLKTPDEPGQYILQVDLLYETFSWFGTVGSTPAQQTITIQP